MQLTPVLHPVNALPTRRRRSRYQRVMRHLETLEARTLLSVSATSYTVPDVFAVSGAYDSAGNLWLVNESANVNGPLLQQFNANHQVVRTIDISSTSPNTMVYANGHMYIADFNQAIDDVDLTTGAVTSYLIAPDSQHTPVELAVAGNGSIWFSTGGNANFDGSFTNYVGHWTPGSATADFLTLSSSVSDASMSAIAAGPNDSAWVALVGTDSDTINGANHLVLTSFDGSNFSSTIIAVNSGDPVADANNYLADVTPDGSGGVWYVLGNFDTTGNPTLRTQHGADTLGHVAATTFAQTGVAVYNSSGTTPQNVRNLGLDSSGHLWFDELDGGSFGFYDPATTSFTHTDYPDGTVFPENLLVNPAGPDVTILTFSDNAALIHGQIDADTVTFGGNATGISSLEGQSFTGTLATFTAPTPVSGHYTATITWADGTSSVVTATPTGGNNYKVTVTKTYASQGTYTGSVVITDSATTVGTLAFTSHITDTPLNVTSFATTQLVSRIIAVTGAFTDDAGEPLGAFTARVNWGDGTASNAIVVRDTTQPGRYLIVGLHVYRKKGTFTLQLSVTTTEANAAITRSTLTSSVTVS